MGHTSISFYLNQTDIWLTPAPQPLAVPLGDLRGTARRAAQFWLLSESDALKAALVADLIATTSTAEEIVAMIATPADTLIRKTSLYQALEGL